MKYSNFFLAVILVFLTFLFQSLRIYPPDSSFFLFGLFVVIICLLILFNHSQRGLMKKRWLKPSYLFVLSYIVVSFQRIVDYCFGLKTGFSYQLAVNHCFILEVIGLTAFALGYCLRQYSHSHGVIIQSGYGRSVHKPSLFLLFLQIIIFVLYLSSINIRQTLSGEAYSLGYTNMASAYSELLFFSVNVAIIYRRVVCGRSNISFLKYLKSLNPVFLFVFILYILLKFVSGDRGPMVYNLLLIVWGFVYVSERRVKLLFVLLFLFLAATIISVLGITRQTKVGEATFSERISESSANYSEYGRFGEAADPTILPATDELAGSFNVTLAGVHAIKISNVDYNKGIYLLINVLNTIPFFSSFSAPYLSSINSSSTDFANKYMGASGYSVGTTLLSDLFLDMGVVWVMIAMLLIGLFFYRIDYIICLGDVSVNKILIVAVLCFSSYAIYIPRSTFFAPVRYWVWACIVLFLDSTFANTSSTRLRQSIG